MLGATSQVLLDGLTWAVHHWALLALVTLVLAFIAVMFAPFIMAGHISRMEEKAAQEEEAEIRWQVAERERKWANRTVMNTLEGDE
jgi:large-conductance mechanosensitive channel